MYRASPKIPRDFHINQRKKRKITHHHHYEKTKLKSIIYKFGQHIELSCSPKMSRNFHINQRKKKEKLPTATIMKN
jgi:hypothetical protein